MTRRATDPATRSRALELAKRMSLRDVADKLRAEGLADVTHAAVQQWVNAAKAEATPRVPGASGGAAAPAARPSPAPRHRKREGEDDLPPELQGLDPDAMDLEVLTTLDKEIGEQVKAAADEPKIWIALVRLRMDLRSAMAKMRPRAVVDPDEDPLSLAARDLALAKIRKALGVGGV